MPRLPKAALLDDPSNSYMNGVSFALYELLGPKQKNEWELLNSLTQIVGVACHVPFKFNFEPFLKPPRHPLRLPRAAPEKATKPHTVRSGPADDRQAGRPEDQQSCGHAGKLVVAQTEDVNLILVQWAHTGNVLPFVVPNKYLMPWPWSRWTMDGGLSGSAVRRIQR